MGSSTMAACTAAGRKSVSFLLPAECHTRCPGTADASAKQWPPQADQEFDSDESAKEARSEGVLLEGARGAEREVDGDLSLADVEAYADEQAGRFAPLLDMRRARRTATASVGRARRAEDVRLQVAASALWQRRGSAQN
ncbi:unnamed protein product [Prorocentrum cordatum]|uniref:Uncharacterized protein n=1 Tax=Prorocentrum cordatum TaxID=2364126 RepID=A0ABN9UTW3_9DINO|nr:unnamed protein product [Polarella glacialis]